MRAFRTTAILVISMLAATGLVASGVVGGSASSPLEAAAEPSASCPDEDSDTDQPYPALISESQPDAYWRLGETEGERLIDSSGNGQDGTYQGGFFSLGMPGALRGAAARESEDTAVRFDGGYAEVPSTDSISPDGTYSVEAWIRPERLLGGPGQGIVEKYSTPANEGFALRLDGAGHVQAFNLGTTGSAVVTGTTAVALDQWHHVAATYDGTALSVYLDGALEASTVTPIGPTPGPATLKIGARGDDAAQRWPGSLDEVALYSRGLTEQDIVSHYRAGIEGPRVVYSRPGMGSFYHSPYGPFAAGQGFVAQGTAITRIASWMTLPTDAPITAEILEAGDFNGPAIGSVQLPAGVTGKIEAEPTTPIPVVPGREYIFKISSPESTQGRVEQQDDIPDSGGYYEGGRSGLDMAMELEYCGSVLKSAASEPVDNAFGPVHGASIAAESFTALDGSLANAAIWLTEANDGPLTVAVHRDTPSGPIIGSTRLYAGPVGKRSISFEPSVPLRAGQDYVVTIGAQEASTTTGVIARAEDDPRRQGYTDSGPTDRDVALQLDFGPTVTRSLTPADCTTQLQLDQAYVESVNGALRSNQDTWGNDVMSRPEGPTYANVKDYLKPLMLVGQPAGTGGNQLTDSGVYYVPMGTPGGTPDSGGPMALHVADGSQLISHRADGRKLTVFVGAKGNERYGLCLASLSEPALDEGYLPALTTHYRDVDGVAYTQGSLVAKLPSQDALASYVRISIEPGESEVDSVNVRAPMTDSGLEQVDNRLVRDDNTYLAFSPGGQVVDGDLQYTVDLSDSEPDVIYLVRPIDPVAAVDVTASETTFDQARTASNDAWRERLAQGAEYNVPEDLVMDAQRNLLIQNLQLRWKYSWGNSYETHFPEGNHAQVTMAEYGFQSDARAGIQTLLGLTHNRSLHWERAAKLLAAVDYYLVTGDRDYILDNADVLQRYLDELVAERASDPNGLLPKDELSHDITTKMYGTHIQSMAWRAMRDMALVWHLVGRDDLADRYRAEAEEFGSALKSAINRSVIEVTDDQTFLPVSLLSDEQPWDPITDTKVGSYWNLVIPYAYASGIFRPDSTLADRVLEYSRQHGSFLLGLQRFNYNPTPIGSVTAGGLPGYKTSGADNLYGVERTEFLADMDRPDDLVLALYGKLAHGMTRGTFISGEGDTIGPVDGEYYRSMYLPPSSFNNDFFLTVLREMLIHTTETGSGQPHGLHLGFSTPRGWLEDGKQIQVADAPTPFGEVSYEIQSRIAYGYVDAQLQVPSREDISDLQLRLRLPAGLDIASAELLDDPDQIVRLRGNTLILTGMQGELNIRAHVRPTP